MVELYKVSNDLKKPNIKLFKAMDELNIPYTLPNPEISLEDIKKIKDFFKKNRLLK